MACGDDPMAWWKSEHSLKKIYDAGLFVLEVVTATGLCHWLNVDKINTRRLWFHSPSCNCFLLCVLQWHKNVQTTLLWTKWPNLYTSRHLWCLKIVHAFKTGDLWGSNTNNLIFVSSKLGLESTLTFIRLLKQWIKKVTTIYKWYLFSNQQNSNKKQCLW